MHICGCKYAVIDYTSERQRWRTRKQPIPTRLQYEHRTNSN